MHDWLQKAGKKETHVEGVETRAAGGVRPANVDAVTLAQGDHEQQRLPASMGGQCGETKVWQNTALKGRRCLGAEVYGRQSDGERTRRWRRGPQPAGSD